MNHLFIIQAHSQLPLIETIVELLTAPNHYFLVHLDKKNRKLLTDPIIKDLKKRENVDVVCFKKVNWGGANQFMLTLELLRSIDIKKYGFIHLLSGADLPVCCNQYFDNFFDNTIFEGFLSFVSPNDAARCAKERLGKYYLYDIFDPRSRFILPRAINASLSIIQNMLEEKFVIRKPLKQQIYKGSQWFSISRNVALYILDYCSNNEAFVNRFKWTSCCDELFFHILIMNSSFATKICHQNLRYIDWREKNIGEPLPRILVDDDYEEIITSGALFCRKIDLEKSKGLIGKLKNYIEVQE